MKNSFMSLLPESFPELPMVFLESAFESCPFCDTPLTVAYHSRLKNVITLEGKLPVKQIALECTNHECISKLENNRRIFQSEEFLFLTLPHCKIGLDVTLYIGYMMHNCNYSLDEVFSRLQQKKIPIDRSTVYRQLLKYLEFLFEVSEATIEERKELFANNGGYILSIDAVHFEDSPPIFVCRDTSTGTVLKAKIVSSENKEEISELLKYIIDLYGFPAAVVSDMNTGIKKSIETLLPGIKHQYCHFHFLKNVGKDLLTNDYTELKQFNKGYKKKLKN